MPGECGLPGGRLPRDGDSRGASSAGRGDCASAEGRRTEALEALLLEYRKAVHDLGNILATAGMRLELHDMAAAGGGAPPTAEAAELAGAMREAIANCRGVIDRLYAARDSRPRPPPS
jgi:hypothetical protein